MADLTDKACSTCFEFFNGSTRKVCTCSGCETKICKACMINWISTNSVTNLRCTNPNCTKIWDLEFLSTQLPKTWIKDNYLNIVHNDLVVQEKGALLQDRIIFDYIEKTNEELAKSQEELEELRVALAQKERECDSLQRQKNNLISNIKSGIVPDIGGDITVISHERRPFILNCTVVGCTGILNNVWRCSSCRVFICSTCGISAGTERPTTENPHNCREEDKSTMQMIRKECKPCPGKGCGALIYKVSGCPQMWCSQCKTVFSWDTLKIDTGRIHNPDYLEWKRKQGEKIEPIPINLQLGICVEDGLPDISHIEYWSHKNDIDDTNLRRIHVTIIHIREVTMRNFAADNRTNIDLRYELITGKINEDAFRKRLADRFNDARKRSAFHNFYETFVRGCEDIFRSLLLTNDIAAIMEHYHQFNELRIYTNKGIKEAAKKFNSTSSNIYYIFSDWRVSNILEEEYDTFLQKCNAAINSLRPINFSDYKAWIDINSKKITECCDVLRENKVGIRTIYCGDSADLSRIVDTYNKMIFLSKASKNGHGKSLTWEFRELKININKE